MYYYKLDCGILKRCGILRRNYIRQILLFSLSTTITTLNQSIKQSINQSFKQTNPNKSYQIINHLDSDMKMNSEEYHKIIQFLREQKYLDTVQASRQTRWNYKRKLSSYFIAECAHFKK